MSLFLNNRALIYCDSNSVAFMKRDTTPTKHLLRHSVNFVDKIPTSAQRTLAKLKQKTETSDK